ncbi:MAG: hypothetical protein ACO1OB_04595 [Archangium sp.]
MKLLGKDITANKVMALVQEKLAARGLTTSANDDWKKDAVEPRVDPLSFNLHALEENSDATKGLPLETHRDGLAGRVVMLAKSAFRRVGQIFINETLGRQTVFNGHVRDSYAQLSAEVQRLRARVAELEGRKQPAQPDVQGIAKDVAQGAPGGAISGAPVREAPKKKVKADTSAPPVIKSKDVKSLTKAPVSSKKPKAAPANVLEPAVAMNDAAGPVSKKPLAPVKLQETHVPSPRPVPRTTRRGK